MGLSVSLVLRHAGLHWAGRVGVVEPGPPRREWTFAELDSGARRVAASLLASGLSGERLLLVAPNSVAFVQALFGAAAAGCIPVPISPAAALAEAGLRTAQARCAAILADERSASLLSQAGAPILLVEKLLRDADHPIETPLDQEPGAPALILSSSGTAGVPRLAVLSHASLFAHAAALVHHTLGLGLDDRVLAILPLTHSFGIRMALLSTFFAGATAVLVPRFDAEATLRLVEKERISWLPAVPTMLAAWAQVQGATRPSALRWCLCAGAPLAEEIALRAEAKLGAQVRQGYGMTEATFSTVNAPPDRRVLGSVGRPVWGVEARIVGPEGHPLAAGDEGEIEVRGPHVMSGYLDEPQTTSAVLTSGWLHTGDLGRRDPEGRLYVLDRIKDLVVRGGHKVVPAEIEHVLHAHPDIAQALVVGRDDAYWGEEVVAVIVARRGARIEPAGLLAWARERISPLKVPHEVALIEALPVGPSGKVLRKEVRKRVASGALKVERPLLKPPSPDSEGPAGSRG